MFRAVELPLWLVVLIVLFAAVTFASHFLFPSVRWFFRRRMERAVARLNTRLERPIEPFKMMRRLDNVNRLIHDPQVMAAVAEYAEDENMPRNVAFEKAGRYAREIVPGFSAATYFGFATRLARRVSGFFYDVRLGQYRDETLREIDPQAAIVFVFNHRSNMDYVLTTQLSEGRSALSYAVGEWARIWPLNILVRAMGAYYIRRRDSNALYRAVLARYVQMLVDERVTQAIFPEGGLSLNGAVGPAKKGLLHYIVRDFNPLGQSDVVFVPVAINYDRVLEDGVLIRAAQIGKRRFKVSLWKVGFKFLGMVWRKMRGQFHSFGTAAVCYGRPVSLRAFLTGAPGANTEVLAETLMDGIKGAMPILPVPLAAAALVKAQGDSAFESLSREARQMVETGQAMGCNFHLPGETLGDTLATGLAALERQGAVTRDGYAYQIVPEQAPLVGYYAASVLQCLAGAGEVPPGHARVAPRSFELPKA